MTEWIEWTKNERPALPVGTKIDLKMGRAPSLQNPSGDGFDIIENDDVDDISWHMPCYPSWVAYRVRK